MTNPTLTELRARLDELDTAICELVNQRLSLAREIGAVKRHSNLPLVDVPREAEVLESFDRYLAGGGASAVFAHALAALLIDESKLIQANDLRQGRSGPNLPLAREAGEGERG